MSEWRTGTLGDWLAFRNGGEGSYSHVGTFPVFGANGVYARSNESNVANAGVIIGRVGSYCGSVHYSPSAAWVSENALIATPHSGRATRYWAYALASLRLNSWRGGSGQPLLNQAILRGIPHSAPSVAEQEAIAEVLGALDDKIAANTAVAATADVYLASVLDEAARGRGATTLNTIAHVNLRSVKPVEGGVLRYVDIAAVGVGSFEYPSTTNWADAPGRARRGLARGDTIWSTVRPNRRSHALNLDDDSALVASTGLAVLTPRNGRFAYLYEATRRPEFASYLENVAEGSAYPAVRADRFLDAPVPDLSQEEITRFEQLASPLRELRGSQDRENRTLAATRDALLPQLMSGRLRVRDAEKIAAEAGA